MAPSYLDTILETEEFITAEEYMRRREAGEINPSEVRYAQGNPESGYVGGFWVKLKTPRYRVAVKSVSKDMCYA